MTRARYRPMTRPEFPTKHRTQAQSLACVSPLAKTRDMALPVSVAVAEAKCWGWGRGREEMGARVLLGDVFMQDLTPPPRIEGDVFMQDLTPHPAYAAYDPAAS